MEMRREYVPVCLIIWGKAILVHVRRWSGKTRYIASKERSNGEGHRVGEEVHPG